MKHHRAAELLAVKSIIEYFHIYCQLQSNSHLLLSVPVVNIVTYGQQSPVQYANNFTLNPLPTSKPFSPNIQAFESNLAKDILF